jgi:hypothetical protein
MPQIELETLAPMFLMALFLFLQVSRIQDAAEERKEKK